MIYFLSPFLQQSITEPCSIALLVCTPIKCQLIRQMFFVTGVVYNGAFLPLILDNFLCLVVSFKAMSSLEFILSTISLVLFCLCLAHIYTHKAMLLLVIHTVTCFISQSYDSIQVKCRCPTQGPIVCILSP